MWLLDQWQLCPMYMPGNCIPSRTRSNRSAEAATHRIVRHRRLRVSATVLLLPRTLAILTPEFLRFRMVWFALNGAVLVIGLLIVARMLGPVAGTRALLFSPLVLASDITIATLQVGNLQAIVSSLAMIAMVLLAQRRYAAGGALLAYATVSKLFPGVLLVYLLVQRKWRALAWTVGLCFALIAISLVDTGWAPYKAFLDHLPRLLGGEAFPAFRRPWAVAHNFSVPGMALKLRLFGVTGASFGAMKIVGWIYSLILLARYGLCREANADPRTGTTGMAGDPDFGVAAQPIPPAVCGHPRTLVSHPAGGHGYTHVQDVVRCTSGLGDAQYYDSDVRGSETCRGNYPAASDGHRDPHRACVARSSRFIGPCVCLTRLTAEKERRIRPDEATR